MERRCAVGGAIYKGPGWSRNVWRGACPFYKQTQGGGATDAISLSLARALGDLERCDVWSPFLELAWERVATDSTPAQCTQKGDEEPKEQCNKHIAHSTIDAKHSFPDREDNKDVMQLHLVGPPS